MKNPIRLTAFLIALALSPSLFAATFVVPSDRELIRRAGTIVIATAGSSYTQLNREGGVETVTPMDVEEIIKGDAGASINVVEPGGTFAGISMAIPGVPRFRSGERMLLLLSPTGANRWAVTELVLGKFKFASDVRGQQLLVRDEDEIVGWDPNLKPHREAHRDAALFLRFVRAEASGGVGQTDYVVPSAPLAAPSTTSTTPGKITANIAPYSANSYTMTISGSMGSRWSVFPNAVNWFSGTTQEPGAPGGGVTAITTGIASWDNDCGSNVNYVYAGQDNGTHTQGLHAPDGANTVLFEQDLSAWGVSPFTCTSNSYGGTLGIGGITSASGNNTVGTETFVTTQEGDVMMNRGIANCTLLFSNGDWNSAVTHELGHTLGFRHADQNRPDNAACSTDPSLECSSSALMTAFVTQGLNAALQAWDQHAVQAVYPGNVCAPSQPPPPSSCTPPVITQSPVAETVGAGTQVTLAVGASGTAPLAFQWFTGPSGSGTAIAGQTGKTLTVTPSTTTSYWVQVSNACGTANSAAATVTVVSSTPPPRSTARHVVMDFNGDGHSDLLWRNASNGIMAMWEMNGRTPLNTSGFAQQPDLNWRVEGTGDFNGDGRADILWYNTATTMVQMWEMNDRTILNGNNITQAGANWKVEAIADFFGTGRSQVIWRNQATGAVAMWELNGHTLVNGGVIGASSDLNWHIEGAADFTGDGKADIIWRNVVTSAVAMWVMDGRTVLSTSTFANAGSPDWHIEGTGDFNGDGFADVLWRNASTGVVAMWEMRGQVILNPGSIMQVDPVWQIVGIGDFEADGTSDIIWRNTSTGQIAMWSVQGHQLLNTGSFATVSDLNWIIEPARHGGPLIEAGRIPPSSSREMPVRMLHEEIDWRRRR